MKCLLLTSLIAFATATTLNVSFRGLDARHALQPYALYYVRRAYACHYGVPTAAVEVVSGTYYNQTSYAGPDINDYEYPGREVPCAVVAATHWSDKNGEDTDLQLYRDLAAEEPFSLTLRVVGPTGVLRPYRINLLPYLAAGVADTYAPILHSVPELFMNVGPTDSMATIVKQMIRDPTVILVSVVLLHLVGCIGLLYMSRRLSRKRKVNDLDTVMVV